MPKAHLTTQQADVKPYDRSSQTPPCDTFLAKVDAAFEAGASASKSKTNSKPAKVPKYDYDKVMLTRLILAVSHSCQPSPSWHTGS